MKFTVTVLGVFCAVILGWAGYWWVGATAKETALKGWLAERRAAGWQAEAAAIDVTGFPNRFDTLIERLDLADPEKGWAWRAPELRLYMVAYQPDKAIVEWPAQQTVAVPGDVTEVDSEKMRASVSFFPGLSLALHRFTVEAAKVDIASRAGWTASLGKVVAAVWDAAETRGLDNAYDVSFDGEEIGVPAPLKAKVDPAGVLPDQISKLDLDATAGLDGPLDRATVEGEPRAMRTLSVRKAAFDWGELGLKINGRMEVMADGRPDGEFDIRARNWRAMLDRSTKAGLIDRNLADTIRTGLEVVSLLSGGGDEIELTLRLNKAGMFLGPVPLGDAPRFPKPKAVVGN